MGVSKPQGLVVYILIKKLNKYWQTYTFIIASFNNSGNCFSIMKICFLIFRDMMFLHVYQFGKNEDFHWNDIQIQKAYFCGALWVDRGNWLGSIKEIHFMSERYNMKLK